MFFDGVLTEMSLAKQRSLEKKTMSFVLRQTMRLNSGFLNLFVKYTNFLLLEHL